MATYEITFITRSEEDNGGVSDLIAQFDGRIHSQATPLRRKLAYPIHKETAGVYHTYLFEMDAPKVRDLNAKLVRNDNVLRYLIIADGIRKPLEQPSKLKNLEVPESVTKGTIELAAEEKAAAEAKPAEEAAAVETPTIAETPVVAGLAEQPDTAHEPSAEEVTAEERQKKLDEKLKSILGND